MSPGRFYITTPIYYTNDVPHLGHAFEVIGIDVQARYRRLIGHRVHFLTGTDEHGQKIAQVAESRGITPQAHVDRVADEFLRVWQLLGISHDDFIRTTSERHQRGVHALWRRVAERGDIYLGKYEGWYDVKEESFVTEAEMRAQGLEPDGKRIRRMSEAAYFFRLAKYRDRVLEFIQGNPSFILPESRRNEVVNSFLSEEVPDLCISRTSIDWGIPVEDAPGHVMYVWFDALTNYISALGYGQEDERLFQEFWPADLHVIGKDILKFHCFIWPAMLFAAGLEPPRQVFGHGFINVVRKEQPGAAAGEKMSKSLGNVINPLDYIDRFGAEALRYYLMREINYGSDGTFNEATFEARYNADLANDLGNLLSRTTGMVDRYLAGQVRRTTDGEREGVEREIVARFAETVAEYERGMPLFEYHTTLAKTWEFIALMNKAITDVQPWSLAKKPEAAERLRIFLSVIIEGLAGTQALVVPFMPTVAGKMRSALGLPDAFDWQDARRWGGLFESTQVRKAEPLFPKEDPAARNA